MERAYQRYAERRRQRQKFSYFLLVLITVGFIALGILAFTDMTYYFYGALFLMTGMFGSLFYQLRQPWGKETLETLIFSNLYQSAEQLDLCSEEDSKSKLCLKKASDKLEWVIVYLSRLEKQLNEVNSRLVGTEVTEPIRQLRTNLKERIMPRIDDPKEAQNMLSVVRGLADMFGNIQRPMKLETIIEKNKALENIGKIPATKSPNRAINYMSKRPIRFVLANVFSFFVLLGLILAQSFMANSNFGEALSSTTNFLTFLGIVVALGLGIYEVTKKL